MRAVSAAVVKLPRAAAVPSYVCDQPGPLPTQRLAFVVVQDNRAVRPRATSGVEVVREIEGAVTPCPTEADEKRPSAAKATPTLPNDPSDDLTFLLKSMDYKN